MPDVLFVKEKAVVVGAGEAETDVVDPGVVLNPVGTTPDIITVSVAANVGVVVEPPLYPIVAVPELLAADIVG